MIDSLTLTRKGYIKHLAYAQKLLELAQTLFDAATMGLRFTQKDCETKRKKKLQDAYRELRERLWEASAVSEKIYNENARSPVTADPEYDTYPRSYDDRESQTMKIFEVSAKEIVKLMTSLLEDPEEGEVLEEPEVVYPGGDGDKPKSKDDPRQLAIEFKDGEEDNEGAGGGEEPPPVDPSHFLDYKEQQANDDTHKSD